jgi:hypothetical protein
MTWILPLLMWLMLISDEILFFPVLKSRKIRTLRPRIADLRLMGVLMGQSYG